METNMKADPEIARAIVEDLERFGPLPAQWWTDKGFPEISVLSSLLDLESRGTIQLKPGTGLWGLRHG